MGIKIFSFFLFSLLAAGGFGASLPKGVKPCRLSDPNLNTCAKEAAQKFLPSMAPGIPELGIPAFEPLKAVEIISDDPVLNFKFTNNRIFGLTTSKIDEIKIDQSKKKITLSLTNTGRLESNYVADGHLIVLPVSGHGKSYISLLAMKYTFQMQYEVVQGNDGKQHWKITKHSVTYAPKEVNFEFSNLFNGNKQLADILISFANNNWREIFGQLGKPAMTVVTNAIMDNIKKVFNKIPIEQMFMP